MSPWDALAIALAGFGAGAMNAVGGSGTLLTFPTVVAVGYPPLLANVSNTVGLVPGSAAAVWGLRAELKGQLQRIRRLAVASACGAVTGAVLLLTLPSEAFDAIVPVLIALAVVLVLVQPRLTAAITKRRELHPGHGGPALFVCCGLVGIYGGYFGAAQGVLLIALLAVFLDDTLHRLNGTKNVLALTANLVAAMLFIAIEDIDWGIAGLIAGGSIVGGLLGARLARKMPPAVLRGVIVVIGTVAIVRLLA